MQNVNTQRRLCFAADVQHQGSGRGRWVWRDRSRRVIHYAEQGGPLCWDGVRLVGFQLTAVETWWLLLRLCASDHVAALSVINNLPNMPTCLQTAEYAFRSPLRVPVLHEFP